jgi:precorrin-6B methylase 1
MNQQEAYGLDTAKRFVIALQRDVAQMHEHLHYLNEWIRLTETGDPHLVDVKSYVKPTRIDDDHEVTVIQG